MNQSDILLTKYSHISCRRTQGDLFAIEEQSFKGWLFIFSSHGIWLSGESPPPRLVASCHPPPSRRTFPEPLRAAFFTRGTRPGILVDWKKEVRGGLADRSLLLSPTPAWPLTHPFSPCKHLEWLLMVLVIVLFIVYCCARSVYCYCLHSLMTLSSSRLVS